MVAQMLKSKVLEMHGVVTIKKKYDLNKNAGRYRYGMSAPLLQAKIRFLTHRWITRAGGSIVPK